MKAFRSRFIDFGRGRRGAQRGVARLHPLTGGARALRLAQTIGQRYAAQPGRRAFTPLILLKRAEPGSSLIQVRPGPVQMDFHIQVAAATGPAEDRGTGRDRQITREVRTSVLDTIQRLVEQHTRVESAARTPADAPTAAPTRLVEPASIRAPARQEIEMDGPPERVMRKQVTAEMQNAQAQPVDAHAQAAARLAAVPLQPATSPALLSAPEINRLAEQVIQTIDRQLIAQRERMGRS